MFLHKYGLLFCVVSAVCFVTSLIDFDKRLILTKIKADDIQIEYIYTLFAGVYK